MGFIPIPFAGLGYGAVKAITKDGASPAHAAAAKMLINEPGTEEQRSLDQRIEAQERDRSRGSSRLTRTQG